MNARAGKAGEQTIVSLEDVAVRYGELAVVQGISADMYPAEITVILGESGCGKTTLLKAILGLQEHVEGVIRLLGRRTDRLEEHEWAALRKRTGVLFQNGALFNSMSILENVAIPLQQHTDLPEELIVRVARSKLALVGLHGVEGRLPAELSGGMRKRAALARAMALDPELLFFDEPSAGLDPVTAAELDSLILSLRERLGVSLVIVTHEVASIRRLADRIMFLDGGRLVFQGGLEQAEREGPGPVRRFFEAAGES